MTYPPADTKAAWHQDDYPGAPIDANVGVIHTTEGTTRPGYEGGATAPNYTALPTFGPEGNYARLKWFAHFPDNRSSRALRNLPGGVETNTLNALQVELVGTCAPTTAAAWRKAGRRFVFWPDAPTAALEDLAEFVAWAHKALGIPLRAPSVGFRPYPESYGDGGQRFTPAQWSAFTGWCGHQHVPENDHGDPGNLAMLRVLEMARDTMEDAAHDPHDEPLTINLTVVRDAFLDALDQDRDPTTKRARVHVRRLQRALRQAFPDANLQPSGMVDAHTLKVWARHEHTDDGTGRPRVPDATSLKALVGARYTIKGDQP